MTDRKAKITRNTKETQIELQLNLDGSGIAEINTSSLTICCTTLRYMAFFDLRISATRFAYRQPPQH